MSTARMQAILALRHSAQHLATFCDALIDGRAGVFADPKAEFGQATLPLLERLNDLFKTIEGQMEPANLAIYDRGLRREFHRRDGDGLAPGDPQPAPLLRVFVEGAGSGGGAQYVDAAPIQSDGLRFAPPN